MLKQQSFKPFHAYFVVLFFLVSSLNIVHADETDAALPSIEQAFPSLTQNDAKQKLALIKSKLNTNIEEWGSKLTRDDFEWTWSGRILKQPKRVEICNIFQGVINDTYSLLIQNKSSLSAEDQKNIESRQAFIQQLGIKNNTIPTKMGFDCIIK